MPTETLSRNALQGDSKRGWLGIAKLGLPGKIVEILELDPEGPAARGNIAVDDRIVRINGRPSEELLKTDRVESTKVIFHYLDDEVLSPPPGTEVTLTIPRGDQVWDVRLVTAR
jgi:C-terminal processing protease CtpA/Prc